MYLPKVTQHKTDRERKKKREGKLSASVRNVFNNTSVTNNQRKQNTGEERERRKNMPS